MFSIFTTPSTTMSFVSASGGAFAKKDVRRVQRTRQAARGSYFPAVLGKVSAHPSYRACSQREQEELVNRVTQVEELASHFDLVYDLGSSEKMVDGQEQEVEDLEVQLVLKHLPIKVEKPVGSVESALFQEYGPLQAYLVIGNMVLEWDCYSVIIPHGKSIRASGDLPTTAGREAELPPVKVKLLKGKLLELVSRYNRLYYYHVINRNTQDFVINVLEVMKMQVPPQIQNKLKGYYTSLQSKASAFIPKGFSSHADLDQFVEDSGRKCTVANTDAEYLIVHYFMFHVESKMKQDNPETWECAEPQCKLRFLEASIDRGQLLLNDFKAVQYNFVASTAV